MSWGVKGAEKIRAETGLSWPWERRDFAVNELLRGRNPRDKRGDGKWPRNDDKASSKPWTRSRQSLRIHDNQISIYLSVNFEGDRTNFIHWMSCLQYRGEDNGKSISFFMFCLLTYLHRVHASSFLDIIIQIEEGKIARNYFANVSISFRYIYCTYLYDNRMQRLI